MKINVKFDNLKYIYHISDIHIRLLKRHDEYKQVFGNLYNQITTNLSENDIIVVTGDIVHSKIEMSPELISVTSDFLDTLGNIAPTLVIAGNHDMSVVNQNRLDALTPILDNLNNSNIHYLKNSGIYTVADTDFAVMSIFGSRNDWPKAKECTSNRKIALFHGAVYGATTDIGYIVNDTNIMIDIFDGFDMVLLGDIHKGSLLQLYSVENINVSSEDVSLYLSNGWSVI